MKYYYLYDVVCDYCNNIIVSDYFGSQVYFLNFDGEFLKYLLIDNEIICLVFMFFFSSCLWISNFNGIVKKFDWDVGFCD